MAAAGAGANARCTTAPPASTSGLPATIGRAGRAVGGAGAVTNEWTAGRSGTTGSCGNARSVVPADRWSTAGEPASVLCSGVEPRVGPG